MNKLLVILNHTRVDQVNFNDPALAEYSLCLIADVEGLKGLCHNIKEKFDSTYPISVQNYDMLDTESLAAIVSFIRTQASRICANQIVITTFGEELINLTHHLRQIFIKSGHIGIVNVDLFRDKIHMKQVLAKEGIRVPRVCPPNVDLINATWNDLKLLLGERVIIKPVTAFGSVDLFLIDGQESLTAAQKILAENKRWHFEAEEYIDGILYHADIQLSRGEIIFSWVGRYYKPCMEFAKGETLGTIMLDRENPLFESLKRFALQSIEILGGSEGSFHCEIFVDKDGPVFLECGCRIPGGWIAKVYQHALGINILNTDIHIWQNLSSQPINQIVTKSEKTGFFIYWPLHTGIVESIEVPILPPSFDMQFEPAVKVGERTTVSTDIMRIAARVCVSGDANRHGVSEVDSIFDRLSHIDQHPVRFTKG